MKMIFSISNKFYLTLGLYSLSPIIALLKDPYSENKPFVFPSSFPYDAQSIVIYVMVNLSQLFVGLADIAIWNAEDVFITITMSYTYARYQMLFQDLDDLGLHTGNTDVFKEKLHTILKKQQILQK